MSRPSSISELADRATHGLQDPSKDFKHWIRTADNSSKAGKVLRDAGNLEAAFVELAKAGILIFERLPTHEDYFTLLTPTQRHNLGLNGQKVLDQLANIKPILVDRYERWRAQHSNMAADMKTQHDTQHSGYDAQLFEIAGRITQSRREEATRGHVHAVGETLRRPKNSTQRKDNEVQEAARLARQLKLEVEDDPLANKSIDSRSGSGTDSTRSVSPCNLTGRVTKSSTHPFASGGFGDIYKGRLNVEGGQIDVVIKTTRVYLEHDQHLESKMRQFRRETAVWSKLDHPNVLPLLGTVFDTSINPDIPGMVCPWVKNGALSSYLETVNLSVAKRFILANDVAHGLQYLHSQHVVHGDLSGSNVLVASDGRACIADFGLSTLLTQLSGSTFATTRQAKGTVRWMAPELLDPDNSQGTPTMQTDVYSFGSIMLQILTGSVPYSHLTRNEQVILAIAMGRRPKKPDGKVIADHWWTFIERCWAPADGTRLRPSSNEIASFTTLELATINAGAVW